MQKAKEKNSAENGLTIINKTKGKLPRLPFLSLKDAVLGKEYELSLAFVTPAESKKLNKTYRGKNKPTDVLSFPLTKKSGEIIIDLRTSRTKAPEFEREFSNFIGFLFIHGLFHLKGFDHGSRMESAEKRVRARFGL